MELTTIQSAVTPTLSIVVQSEDAVGNRTEKTWKLCLDYRALAKIEETTKRDLKRIDGWKDLSSGREFPQIVWCCLSRFSPEVTLEDVLDNLNPQAHRLLSDALFELTFPGVAEAWAKHQSEAKDDASPNEQPALTKTA
jgi:hypothetical protein